MFRYDKKLQYPVKIDRPNPKLARIILTQYGGPDGELGASLRYLSQRYSMPFDELKGLLTDIGTEGSLWNRILFDKKYMPSNRWTHQEKTVLIAYSKQHYTSKILSLFLFRIYYCLYTF